MQLLYNVRNGTVAHTTTRVISRTVLKGLAGAGALSTALVAPNTLQIADMYFKKQDKRNVQRTLHYLKYRQLIEVKQKNGVYSYKLTRKGHDRYEKILLDELRIKTPLRWDQKWRLVLFDIPAGYQSQRNELLYRLKMLNFYMLQKSAWMHPC